MDAKEQACDSLFVSIANEESDSFNEAEASNEGEEENEEEKVEDRGEGYKERLKYLLAGEERKEQEFVTEQSRNR